MGLNRIVDIYIRKIRPLAQEELDYFQNQPSFLEAIHKAALAINRKGKRYSHQRRLSKSVLNKSDDILGANSSTIIEVNSFEELHGLIDRLVRDISGIGPLYVYDTSLRIGAYLGVSPQQIYLHAGTKEGAKSLGLETIFSYLEVGDLPSSLEQLEPHEVEDFLCIFKDDFKELEKGKVEDEVIQRSRHC